MEESLICEGKLIIEESTNAIFKMRLNQSPGYDGITVEFYNFGKALKIVLLQYSTTIMTEKNLLNLKNWVCKLYYTKKKILYLSQIINQLHF
jgi:23S rRNA G2069 N7-methylase RlmK/C1962 C5-methylase RlmI